MQISTNNHIDYSEMYRTQETIQLNKKLRKTRNILLICAVSFVAGAVVFWVMPETSFTTKNFLVYLGLAGILILLSMISNKQPFFSIAAALLISICYWGVEIFFNDPDGLIIESSIHKLFVISLLVGVFTLQEKLN
jgi:ABC-type uncharacterized transport system permease subunit